MWALSRRAGARRRGRTSRTRLIALAGSIVAVAIVAGGILLWLTVGSNGSVLYTTRLFATNAAGSVAVDERAGRAVVSGLGPYLSILDTGDGRLLRTITIGGLGRLVAPAIVSEGTGHTFVAGEAAVANGAAKTMSVVGIVDTHTGAVVQSVLIPDRPELLAVDERSSHVFIVSIGATGPGSVRMLDARRGTLLRRVSVGLQPCAMAVDVRTRRGFIVNYLSNTVSVLDTRTGTIMGTVAVGHGPVAAAVDEQTGRVFVVNGTSRTISMLNANTGRVLRTIGLRFPIALAVDPTASRVIVAGSAPSSTVSVLDSRSGMLLTTLKVGGDPTGVAVDARTHRAFVTSTGTQKSNWLHDLGHGQLSWAGEYDNGNVTVLDTQSDAILRTVGTGPSPRGGIAVDERTGHVFVLNHDANSVSVIDASR